MRRRWSGGTRKSRVSRAYTGGDIATWRTNCTELPEGIPRPHGRPICLCHEGHDQVLPRRSEAGAQPHQPAILPRRQDRHRRAERGRQVDPDEDHGRHRQGLSGRGLARREHHRRLSAAGAAARPEQERARERQGRRARGRRHGRSVQRHLGRDGRPQGRHRLRRADGGNGRAPGQDRRGRRLDARQSARSRDGGAALPAVRLAGGESLRRREAPHRADPAADPEARRSCCSTSLPTTSTPKASSGSRTTSRNIPVRC